MRLPPYFRRSSSAPEAARLELAGSMTHSARVCLGFDALHFARMSCLFTLALEGRVFNKQTFLQTFERLFEAWQTNSNREASLFGLFETVV